MANNLINLECQQRQFLIVQFQNNRTLTIVYVKLNHPYFSPILYGHLPSYISQISHMVIEQFQCHVVLQIIVHFLFQYSSRLSKLLSNCLWQLQSQLLQRNGVRKVVSDGEKKGCRALCLASLGEAGSQKMVDGYFCVVSDIGGELLVLAQLLQGGFYVRRQLHLSIN